MAWSELSASAWRDHAGEPLDLDSSGLPETSALVVLADAEPASPSSVRRRRGPVVVAVAESADELAADLLVDADVVLVARDPGPGGVLHAEPLHAARELAAAIGAEPVAATSLAWLLRAGLWFDVHGGLMAESATYSMLLASEEMRAWRERVPVRTSRESEAPRVRITREDDVLRVTLTRASRRNAMDAFLRDALLEALEPARWDPSLAVVIDAEGPSFSSGGDLDEFASAPDVGRAHLVRSVASVGRILAELGERVEVRVHGVCIGAGVEVPAFAGRVVARADATFRLPEVAMGLVPGAGGTVSVPRRVGRQRAAWLMLSGSSIDATTALSWGLVDAVE